jgi:hypothetical protein
MKEIQDIAAGFVVGLCVLGTLAMPACGTAITPQLVQCKLEALRVLPADPKMATVYDAVEIIERVKACHGKAEATDGGSP